MIIDKDTLRSQLRDDVKTITFTKKDGTERVMKCTLSEMLIPQEHKPKGESTHKQSDEAIAAWDVEKEGWRSFRYDSIISVV